VSLRQAPDDDEGYKTICARAPLRGRCADRFDHADEGVAINRIGVADDTRRGYGSICNVRDISNSSESIAFSPSSERIVGSAAMTVEYAATRRSWQPGVSS
jgi:hypothetical protein